MRIDEDAFVDGLLSRLSHGSDVAVPPGDDCAGLKTAAGNLLLLAVDQVVADVHYVGLDAKDPTPPQLAGRKLLARNLSDVAAMGGIPTHALTAIGLPKDTQRERLEAFMDGIVACASEFNVDLVGGDLCASGNESASLTIVGTVEEDRVCLRSNAKDGDRIFVTGNFGGSLKTGSHLSFSPRLKEGRWLALEGFTRCMIDVSDGLLKDTGRVARASALAAELYGDAIPITQGCDLNEALTDGEDYELIVAVPSADAERLVAAWPFDTPLHQIGCFQSGPAGRVIVNADNDDDAVLFNHFSRF